MVSIDEISDPKNDFNLNIPRYIDSQETEDIQDIAAHLMGGIPNADIEALNEYWTVYETLKAELFAPGKRQGYSELKIGKDAIKQTIFQHPEFVSFSLEMDSLFGDWKTRNTELLKNLTVGIKPKETIFQVSEDALKTYTGKALMDKYDVYQHLMNYWNETMQDDCYLIAADGWKAEPYRILVKNKAGADVDKGWDCDLVPKTLVIDRYFEKEKTTIEKLEARREDIISQLTELEEEHGGEDGYFADMEKVNKVSVQKRLKEIKTKDKVAKGIFLEEAEQEVSQGEAAVLEKYLKLVEDQADLNKKIKDAITDLDKKALNHYKTLTEADIKQLVVDDKWMSSIERSVKTEMERISQRLTQRIKELTERYEYTLGFLAKDAEKWEVKVMSHLQKMGF
ncbi:hypothetical protein DYBT9275_03721 [Dyadobacter sp. CECT 9275]|uniref:Uncharacterized protein n=1 Tax=Dyadobacter helix TaxID=2822344 RepID=A0A916JGR2_9BACT|nr:hypothetical protein [Dyadobacter sp. CECT 9275]CAG5006074.1 hypothetical protein DYBT9275_03721 [Dyadobacter sp. CECT 9275]